MDKIKFTTPSLLDGKTIVGPAPTDEKYILLSLFVGNYRFPTAIQEKIKMFEAVQSGAKTWDELIAPYGAIGELYFAHGSGSLIVEDDTAIFLPDGNNEYKSVEMPLQELIDLMKGWLAFMS
jgi:hypothetical protein